AGEGGQRCRTGPGFPSRAEAAHVVRTRRPIASSAQSASPCPSGWGAPGPRWVTQQAGRQAGLSGANT
ncbi:hypothetical protein, partial [Streptomyces sp. SID5789]|uniref:hypothetical protein n=1 Tax=Streptomyces sp. SID5789 TaxID=2690310 RepID=UPI001F38D6B1